MKGLFPKGVSVSINLLVDHDFFTREMSIFSHLVTYLLVDWQFAVENGLLIVDLPNLRMVIFHRFLYVYQRVQLIGLRENLNRKPSIFPWNPREFPVHFPNKTNQLKGTTDIASTHVFWWLAQEAEGVRPASKAVRASFLASESQRLEDVICFHPNSWNHRKTIGKPWESHGKMMV